MTGRIVLTDKYLTKLKPAPSGERLQIWDAVVPGLALRVTDSGHKSFSIVRRLDGRLRRWSIGSYPGVSLAAARKKARTYLDDVTAGTDPTARTQQEQAETRRRRDGTFSKIAETFVDRYAKRQTRSWEETERIFRVYVEPSWGSKPIGDISRLDVVTLLDTIEDENGAVMADRVLAAVRKLLNWHATRDETFRSPVVKGMARTKPKERERERTLTDDEIRAHWQAWDEVSIFGDLERFLLMTGQRRGDAAGSSAPELTIESIGGRRVTCWTVPGERHKSKRDHVVPLPRAALAILQRRPVMGSVGLFFTGTGLTPFSGFSKAKAEVVKLTKVTDRTTHDLRRTARSLMSRAGVASDIAEIVLGHKLAGVRGTYDRWAYLPEKYDALRRLALMVAAIVTGREHKRALLGWHLDRTERRARVMALRRRGAKVVALADARP